MPLHGQAGKYENKLIDDLAKYEIWSIRSAGSLGDGDVVVNIPAGRSVRGNPIVEVKAIKACSPSCNGGGPCKKNETFRPSRKRDDVEQYDSLAKREAERYAAFYGIYKKGKNGGWRFLKPSQFSSTREGGRVAKWGAKGQLTLVQFVRRVVRVR